MILMLERTVQLKLSDYGITYIETLIDTSKFKPSNSSCDDCGEILLKWKDEYFCPACRIYFKYEPKDYSHLNPEDWVGRPYP